MWGFTGLQRAKEFATYLSERLSDLGEDGYSNAVQKFSYSSYTTPTEYLGEFRSILKTIINSVSLDEATRSYIQEAIAAIDRAFGQ